MNYRHAYHAGNFADVLKHAVLALVIEYMKLKPAPFRVIDTHAGVGLYQLMSMEAQKTGEWLNGIARLLATPIPQNVAPLLASYLNVVRELNPETSLVTYPGSPLIARQLIRPQDKLVVTELHPDDHATLARRFARDRQVKVLHLDGYTALKSLLPPPERRAVVLVDPPFEQRDELDRMIAGLDEALRRFATGTFLLWYPLKRRLGIEPFKRRIMSRTETKALCCELAVRGACDLGQLTGSGLIVVNPPYTLFDKLGVLGPFLRDRLGDGEDARFTVSWNERA